MTAVQRSPRMPQVPRKAHSAPGDVVFKRSDSSGGVSAQGEGVGPVTVASQLVASVTASQVRSLPVSSVPRQSCSSSVSVASVLSASKHAVPGPKSTLARVLEGLRLKARSAKVQRGRQRLSRGGVPGVQSRVSSSSLVASELVQVASGASKRAASQSLASVRVASQSVLVACELSPSRASSRCVSSLN